MQWSCRTGGCHNCETALISGTVDYTPEPLEPPAPLVSIASMVNANTKPTDVTTFSHAGLK